MSEADWKRAAIAELRYKIDGSIARVHAATEAERNARLDKEAAQRDIEDIRAAAATLGLDLGADYEAETGGGDDEDGATAGTAREIIVDELRKAFPRPMKAAELRTAIEKRMGREVHYKTPGMSLYRLAEAGLVRREGHRWFAVQGDNQRREGQQSEEEPISTNSLL